MVPHRPGRATAPRRRAAHTAPLSASFAFPDRRRLLCSGPFGCGFLCYGWCRLHCCRLHCWCLHCWCLHCCRLFRRRSLLRHPLLFQSGHLTRVPGLPVVVHGPNDISPNAITAFLVPANALFKRNICEANDLKLVTVLFSEIPILPLVDRLEMSIVNDDIQPSLQCFGE